VPFIYFLLTSTEGNFITPIMLGQRFTLNPIVIFVWLIFWGWIWGVAGAFIAVPLLVAFKILCDHIESLRPVGEFITITKEDEARAARGRIAVPRTGKRRWRGAACAPSVRSRSRLRVRARQAPPVPRRGREAG
jgi:hypothetical protein